MLLTILKSIFNSSWSNFILAVVLGGIISGILGYIKGYHDCFLKNEVNLKEETIKFQKSEIIWNNKLLEQEREANQISNDLIKKYQNIIESQNIKYNNLQRQWNAKKDYLNSTNHITNEWLRFIQSGITNNSQMPTISPTSSGINESSSNYSAYRVGSYINEQFEKCNDNIIQLQSLQQWIIQQESLANGTK